MRKLMAALLVFICSTSLVFSAGGLDNSPSKTWVESEISDNAANYATAAQGLKADSALQTGASYTNISGLGTAANSNANAFATAAQGTTADTAAQKAGGNVLSGTQIFTNDIVCYGDIIFPFGHGIKWMATNDLADYANSTNYVYQYGASTTQMVWNYSIVNSNVTLNLISE